MQWPAKGPAPAPEPTSGGRSLNVTCRPDIWPPRRRAIGLLGALAALLLPLEPGHAQSITQGMLEGQVRDQAGTVLVGTPIRVTERATGVSWSLSSDQEGRFRLSLLRPGDYDIFVEEIGFQPRLIEAVPLRPRRSPARGTDPRAGPASRRRSRRRSVRRSCRRLACRRRPAFQYARDRRPAGGAARADRAGPPFDRLGRGAGHRGAPGLDEPVGHRRHRLRQHPPPRPAPRTDRGRSPPSERLRIGRSADRHQRRRMVRSGRRLPERAHPARVGPTRSSRLR